ncbi:type IV pilus biogenesis protein PilM [Escherichia coli]
MSGRMTARGLQVRWQTSPTKTALAGRVKGRRLLNTTGQDTGISVPSVIPDSAFVYFN